MDHPQQGFGPEADLANRDTWYYRCWLYLLTPWC
jgi:hypothetical protein